MEMSTERHPSTMHMMAMLDVNPNLKGDQADIATMCYDVARTMFLGLKDSPELTAGLRKLLEAKDCFVRASLDLTPVDYRDR